VIRAELPAGGYALMPAQMHHYVLVKTPLTIQVHAIGPFVIQLREPGRRSEPHEKLTPPLLRVRMRMSRSASAGGSSST
jgi:hypothetical protein